MSGEVRKGERIPRRDPPPYEEADSLVRLFRVTDFSRLPSTMRINMAFGMMISSSSLQRSLEQPSSCSNRFERVKPSSLTAVQRYFKPNLTKSSSMSEGSVNVESRTSSQDKRWTIMAALLGTNTAIMLFQGMEQEANPTQIREVALTIIAATLPFRRFIS